MMGPLITSYKFGTFLLWSFFLILVDSGSVLIVEFQSNELDVSEAMGTVNVTVIANGTNEFNYTVNLIINDFSTDSNDHNLTVSEVLEFPAGSTSASVVIGIDDDVYENTESFQVVITSTSDDHALIGMNNETTVNIEDDEMITVFFQQDPFSFSESDGEALVTVYADLPTGGLAVNITLDVHKMEDVGSGSLLTVEIDNVSTGPADYNDCPTNFTLFATTNSTTTAKLEFTIIDDDILERDEVLTIVLDTTESRVNIANSTSVIILNDNVMTVAFENTELNVSEEMNTIEVTVIANGTSEFDYTVNLTTSDITADSNDHNLPEYKQLEFPAGSTSASVVIAIDDDLYENTESFQIAITSTSDEDVLIGMINETTVNIEDDEMITVFFQEDSYSFSESDGEAIVIVYADLPTGGLAVNIPLGVNITNGTATSPIDYDDSLALVYLYATTGSKAMVELSITIEEDAIVENDEDFNIMLTTSETRLTIANSTVVIIHDDVWPIITTELESNTLVTGSNHTFVCAAIGDPPPTFGWRFNGDRIPQDTSKYSITSNRTHTLLTVYNLMVSDDGEYTCLASNRYGTASTSANIIILYSPQLLAFPSSVRIVVEGETLVVSCLANGKPTPVISWTRNNMSLRSSESENIRISSGGQRLTISNFTKSNNSDYSCTASNEIGNSTRSFQINSIERPTIIGINISADSIPSSSISHSGNISIEGFSTNIIFTCTANGMPLPEIEWLFDGTVLSSNNRIAVVSSMVSTEDGSGGFSVSTLTISTLQLSDRGMYTCRAISGNVSPIPGLSAVTFELIVMGPNPCTPNPCQNNGECVEEIGNYSCLCREDGSVVYSGRNCTIVIDLTSPPTITNQPRGRNDRLFDKVTLTCSADGNPNPVIRWYKDGAALEGPQSVGGVYTIDRIKPEDRGSYHCQVNNIRGNVTSNNAIVSIKGIVQFRMYVNELAKRKKRQVAPTSFEELRLLAVGQTIGGTGDMLAEIVSMEKVAIGGSSAMTIIVTVNTNSTQPPAVLTEMLIQPISAQFVEYSDILQSVSFEVQTIERFDGCPVEVTINCSNIANITWPETEIGDETSVRCPCGPEDENPLPEQTVATRRCVGDYENGARWEDPKCAECQFLDDRRTLCQLLEVDSAAQVAFILANLTEEADNLQSEDITIASALLDSIANSSDIQGDSLVRDDFFLTIDNIVNFPKEELRSSNENNKSLNRITNSFDRVVDTIPLPENDTSGNASITFTFNNFAIQIQQLPQDNTSFTPNLTQLIMGIGNMNTTLLRENVNTTGSVTLPPELTTFQSVAFAVFLRTSLYPPSNVNSSVGSIIIAVSIPNQIVDNLREPVNFSFQKNEVVKRNNNSNNLTCSFWDNAINEGRGDWSSRGCVSVNETEDEVTCQCDHLTSFSILLTILPSDMLVTSDQTVDTILTVVSYIGSSLSVIALVIALVTYLAEKNFRKELHQKLLISLMFALLGLYVTFIITNAVSSYQDHLPTIPVVCGILSALLHYFFLVTFLCMASIAINLYRQFVVVLNAEIKGYLPMAVSICWVVPFFIVGFSIAPSYKYYIGEIIPYCRAQSWPFYFGLIVPFGLIYIFNIIMFIIIISSLIRRPNVQKKSGKYGNLKKLKENLWVMTVLSLLFGVSWVFGLLATAGLLDYIRLTFDIVFTVLASLQGVLVFLLYCMKYPECRQLWKNWMLCRFTKRSQLVTSSSAAHSARSTTYSSSGTLTRLTSIFSTLNLNGFRTHKRKNNSTHSANIVAGSVESPPIDFEQIDVDIVGHYDDAGRGKIIFEDQYSVHSFYFGITTGGEGPSKEMVIMNKEADGSHEVEN